MKNFSRDDYFNNEKKIFLSVFPSIYLAATFIIVSFSIAEPNKNAGIFVLKQTLIRDKVNVIYHIRGGEGTIRR